MKFFNLSRQDEVLEMLNTFADGYDIGVEVVNITKATGRITSSPIVSQVNVPSFNRSTVDGYAIHSKDSHSSSEAIPAIIKLIGIVEMGKETKLSIKRDEASYVPTGGMIPAGADTVIMIEDTQVISDIMIGLKKSIPSGANIIYEGDDIKVNQVAIDKGKKISPMDIGVLCALGISQVQVYKKPIVTIISTGDEIIDLDETIRNGQIYDINGYVLEELVNQSAGIVIHREIVKDDYNALYESVSNACDQSDIVLISGGSSVGTRDFTYDVIKNLENSKIYVEGIAIKPGKPTIIGEGKGKLVFGLPGHPVSSIMIYKCFVDYYIRQLMGGFDNRVPFEGKLTENIYSAPGKTTYQMVYIQTELGITKVVPHFGKSGLITLLAGAKGYTVIEAYQEGIDAGEIVKGYYL